MIKVYGLKKKYKKFELKDVTFELPKGKITALIGPNGAGKSTILKIVSGLKMADEGKILLEGREILNLSQNFIMGYLSQEQEIYPDIQLKDLTKFIKNTYKRNWDHDKFTKYFDDLFQLDENMKIKELSTGMRVKYFLALELAKQPNILLLDEPTSGLDPMIREEVLEILQRLSEKDNVTILFSSHITEDIEKIGDRVIYLYDGQVLLEDEKDCIKKNYVQISNVEINNMEDDLKNLIYEKAIRIQNYFVCSRNEDDRLQKYGKEALLGDVLMCLKAGV